MVDLDELHTDIVQELVAKYDDACQAFDESGGKDMGAARAIEHATFDLQQHALTLARLLLIERERP